MFLQRTVFHCNNLKCSVYLRENKKHSDSTLTLKSLFQQIYKCSHKSDWKKSEKLENMG